jgi:hypothetical protein
MDPKNEALLKAVDETVKTGFNDFMEKTLLPTMEEDLRKKRPQGSRADADRTLRPWP